MVYTCCYLRNISPMAWAALWRICNSTSAFDMLSARGARHALDSLSISPVANVGGSVGKEERQRRVGEHARLTPPEAAHAGGCGRKGPSPARRLDIMSDPTR